MNKLEIVKVLQQIDVIRHGDFILKSGRRSSVYVDLRHLVSYPPVLQSVSDLMYQKAETFAWDLVCGVPYNAIPLATCVSLTHNKPMLIRRKEIKQHGTKKQVEGKFLPGQTCLVLEDVVTTGGSILETIEDLRKEGVLVTDAVVFVKREDSARTLLLEHGCRLHSVLTLEDILT